MALTKSISDLKSGPKEDKVAVASGIAITVVVVMLVAWAIIFFKKIQSGAQRVNLGGGAQDQFNLTGVKQAQEALKNAYSNTTSELNDIRNASASGQLDAKTQAAPQQIQNSGADNFGQENTSY